MFEAVAHQRVLPRMRRGLVDTVNDFNINVVKGVGVRIFGQVAVHEWRKGYQVPAYKALLFSYGQWRQGNFNAFHANAVALLKGAVAIGVEELELIDYLLKTDAVANLPIVCDLLGSYGSPWYDPFLGVYSDPDATAVHLMRHFDREMMVGEKCRVGRVQDHNSPGRGLSQRYVTFVREDCVMTDVSARRVKYRQRRDSTTFDRQRLTDFYTFVASNWRTPP